MTSLNDATVLTRDPEELARGCASGEADAIATCTRYLASAHPYTRAMAAEALAGLPSAAFAEHCAAGVTSGQAMWWFALRLRHDAGLEMVPAQLQEMAAQFVTATADSAADGTYLAVRAAVALPYDLVRDRLAELMLATDDEIAVSATVARVAHESIGDAGRARLHAVRGELVSDALLLLLDDGDASSVTRAVEAALRGGPLSFALFDSLEALPARDSASQLAAEGNRKFIVRPVHVRASAAALALGQAGAAEALRRYGRSRKDAVRRLAWHELARVGDDDDAAALLRMLDGPPDLAIEVLASLGTVQSRDLTLRIVETARSHASTEMRHAAVDVIGTWLPDGSALALLHDLQSDPVVGATATTALRPPPD